MEGRLPRPLGAATALVALFLTGLPAHAQTVVWTQAGTNTNFTTPANWMGGAPPPNNGVDTLDLSLLTNGSIGINTAANVAGIVFLGTSSYSDYNLYQVGGGSLSIGSGGITTPFGAGSLLFEYGAPIILTANQTWDGSTGYIDVDGNISGSKTLTTMGAVYLYGNNTFTGGVNVATGTFYASSNTAAGTGTISVADGAALETWYDPAVLANPVTLDDTTILGSNGPGSYYALTLAGPVSFTNASSNLGINYGGVVIMTGTLEGPPSTSVTVSGANSTEPLDGGSQLVLEGHLNNITGLNVSGVQVILAPTGDPATSFASVTPSGLQVNGSGYLGLDGTFTNPGAVAAFLSTYGSSLGPSINGTLGFDTVGNPGTPNVFSDPINLNHFYSEGFLGLGSSTTAILTGMITPSNNYMFGGGGGTLTIQSNLTDFDGTELIMTAAPAPVTVLLQGSNTYQGGTRSSGGVLIFDSPTPTYGQIYLYGGYVGYTENATNITNAQQFVSQFSTYAGNGVIGFDSANAGSPRTITDSIDLSGFNSDNVPYIGTATAVTLSGTITPANGQYQFTGVKGGQLTVTSNLTDGEGSSLTIGLQQPIESNQSESTVTLTGDNSFTLGTTFYSGALFINNDNALGTGPITVPDTATSNIIPSLSPFGGTVTLANPISVGSLNGGPGLTVGNASTSDMLVLNGIISDYSGPGQIGIQGSVTLGGVNTYSGGTTFSGYNALALVTNASSFGSGPISVEDYATIAPLNVDVALDNDINLNSTLTLGQSGDGNKLTLNGVISGGWNVVINSDVVLNGANSYTDGTSINDANVLVGDPGGLGTGSLTLSDSTLTFGPSVTAPTILDLTGDSGSTIVLAPASTLTIDTDLNVTQPAVYSGVIQGDASTQLIKIDVGTEYLGGTSTYGGGTSVNAGGLIAGASGSLGTGPISVASGALLGVDTGANLTNPLTLSAGGTLSGIGTFSPPGGVTFASGSIVWPGNQYGGQSIGSLSFGTGVTFGTGGIYTFNLATASGVAGVDYSTINVTGSLSITSTPGTPFVISVASIDPSSGNPGLANFNSSLAYSWTLATAGSITGFSANDFSFTTTEFQNALGGGSFAVGEVGNMLTLNFTPVPEPSTWMLLAAGLTTVGAALRRRRRGPR